MNVGGRTVYSVVPLQVVEVHVVVRGAPKDVRVVGGELDGEEAERLSLVRLEVQGFVQFVAPAVGHGVGILVTSRVLLLPSQQHVTTTTEIGYTTVVSGRNGYRSIRLQKNIETHPHTPSEQQEKQTRSVHGGGGRGRGGLEGGFAPLF